MNFLNVSISELRGEAFLHATTSQIGTWLLLGAYCASQINGGRIRNCKNWSPATWIKITGTETPAMPCQLWHWHRDDLIVHFYPADQERVFLNRQASGKIARSLRWSKNNDFTSGASQSLDQ